MTNFIFTTSDPFYLRHDFAGRRFWPITGESPMNAYPLLSARDIDRYCDDIHTANVEAGWWSDLKTGERIDRNHGELFMLVVSEIWEGVEGLRGDLNDDKLVHRKMIEVELADAAIRLFDIGGGLKLDLGGQFATFDSEHNRVQHFSQYGLEGALLSIIGFISKAMEADRKRKPGVSENLAKALIGIFTVGSDLDLDVIGAIREKREFNRTREDHQKENRARDDGKKY